MGRYYYPNALDALSAKKQFLSEHHYNIRHCFQNVNGSGYVLFDSKEEVNDWWIENTGEPFYKDVYMPKTVFTKSNAFEEIYKHYGKCIEETLATRDYSLPVLAVGLPSATAFGNDLFLRFTESSDEDDIEHKFYIHYYGYTFNVKGKSNSLLKDDIIQFLYKYFYKTRFSARIESSKQFMKDNNIVIENKQKTVSLSPQLSDECFQGFLEGKKLLCKGDPEKPFLIEIANHEFAKKSPIEINVLSLCDSSGYDIGAYCHDDKNYYISFGSIHYKGTWKSFLKEYDVFLGKADFDLKFVDQNTDFIMKGSDFGISLSWPWGGLSMNEEVNQEVLVNGIFPKNKNPNLEKFINSFFTISYYQDLYMDSCENLSI